MTLMKTLEKALFKLIVGMLGFITIAFIVMTICCGPFGSGADSTASEPIQIPIEVQTQIESSIDPHIIVHQDSQDQIVECNRLSVFGNNNAIQIANDDVEKILITGHGNTVSYSCDVNPQIVDHGDYNDVWQRWLT